MRLYTLDSCMETYVFKALVSIYITKNPFNTTPRHTLPLHHTCTLLVQEMMGVAHLATSSSSYHNYWKK